MRFEPWALRLPRDLPMQTVEITIEGMVCGACAGTLRFALVDVPGVVYVHVQVGKASILFDPLLTSDAVLRRTIIQAGYLPSH